MLVPFNIRNAFTATRAAYHVLPFPLNFWTLQFPGTKFHPNAIKFIHVFVVDITKRYMYTGSMVDQSHEKSLENGNEQSLK